MNDKKRIISKIEKEARRYFESADGCHDWTHIERVRNLALRIGKKEKADLFALEIAVLLHDTKKKEEMKSKGLFCHAEHGGKIARKILEKYNLNKEAVENIVHSIEAHRHRNKIIPNTLEAKILFDADKLDSIGAVGIGRDFLFAGEIGAKFHDPNVSIKNTKEYSKEDTAYREFLVKLIKIKSQIITKEGRKIARERHEYMVEFFERLNKEVEGVL
jgi:uncharacterized protein